MIRSGEFSGGIRKKQACGDAAGLVLYAFRFSPAV
jgi:hypothetical protein